MCQFISLISKKLTQNIYTWSKFFTSNSKNRENISLTDPWRNSSVTEFSRDELKEWERTTESEHPRSLHYSPSPNERIPSPNDYDLPSLLDNVISAQEKYIKLFPNLKYKITNEGTKSFEDITFWWVLNTLISVKSNFMLCNKTYRMLNQGLFIYEEYK